MGRDLSRSRGRRAVASQSGAQDGEACDGGVFARGRHVQGVGDQICGDPKQSSRPQDSAASKYAAVFRGVVSEVEQTKATSH